MPDRLIFLLLSLVVLATVSTLLTYHHMMEMTLERRDRAFSRGGDDEDIPTTQPSPPTVDDPIVADQDKSNDEIRIGPITRARAMLLQR
jgi:hypothetical protein